MPALALDPGSAGVLQGAVPECSVGDLLDDIGDAMRGAVQRLQEAAPELGQRVGEAAREAAEAFEAGLSSPDEADAPPGSGER